ncbi:MAG: hypothetical protein ACAF41_24885 [Leptolyngbya sp. BL-A-14]
MTAASFFYEGILPIGSGQRHLPGSLIEPSPLAGDEAESAFF